ncbi:MAG: Na+/H+ antiporter subunit E [Oscillospiraceae bacterium]|nr:Na+/H+ antiporter subunit E [Oscillospiraceae bacterium]
MKRNFIYLVIVFTIIWIILKEEITLSTILIGLAISVVCVVFCRKFLPLDYISGVNYFKLFIYIFYVFGQMYVGAVFAIKLVLTGAKADVVKISTDISNDFLRVMLANSITLVPGSVTLELKDDSITVLLLHEKTWGLMELANASDRVKGGLEDKLIKVQKSQRPDTE